MKLLVTKHVVRTQLFINRSAIEYPSKDHHVLKRKHKFTMEIRVMMLLRGHRPRTQGQLGNMSLHQAGSEPGAWTELSGEDWGWGKNAQTWMCVFVCVGGGGMGVGGWSGQGWVSSLRWAPKDWWRQEKLISELVRCISLHSTGTMTKVHLLARLKCDADALLNGSLLSVSHDDKPQQREILKPFPSYAQSHCWRWCFQN